MLSAIKGKCTRRSKQKKRFYYNSKSKTCKEFTYCSGGNENNFKTLKACQQKCFSKKSTTFYQILELKDLNYFFKKRKQRKKTFKTRFNFEFKHSRLFSKT